MQEINRWASDSTDGLIDNIVNEFSPNTITVLANALYFADRWLWELDSNDAKEGIFYSPSGERPAYFMLREGNNQSYYEDDTIQAIRLEFKTGGGLCVLLPKTGDAKGLLSSITPEKFNSIMAGTEQKTGKLLLPRFTINSGTLRLADELKLLGIQLIGERQYTLLDGFIEGDTPVWISEVMQEAFIEVDENGTTAAAVTVIAAAGARPNRATDPFEMICDKPFVFILYGDLDSSLGSLVVLFIGTLNLP